MFSVSYCCYLFFFFKQKTAYEMRISDWSSDVCSSDLAFAEDIRDRYGVAVDAAIHAPHDYGDDRNHHAHVMTTTRMVDADGLGAKTRQLDVRSSASIEVEEIRASWAAQVNDALELAQVAERVDHRSYARQGVEMEPTVKMGHASAAIERRAYAEQIADGAEPHAVTQIGRAWCGGQSGGDGWRSEGGG